MSRAPAVREGATIDAPLTVEEAHAQRMRSLGEFAANIAHDFNNVLTVLLARAELARDALASGDTGRALEELDVLSSSALGGGDLVRKRERGWGAPGTYCAISVTDSGTGMSDEVRAKALDPFFTTKRAGEGTGLGLAMAYGVMKQHGGWIDIASRPGHGTRVDLMFPLHEGVESGALPQPVATRGRGERIVLVEDDDAIRESTARLLKRNGYVVRSARDGVEGIELLRHWPEADLVVLDLAMPRLGGREVSAALDEAGYRVPVLFVTGTAAMDEDLGPVLRKPWHAPDLLARVRAVLDAGVRSVA